MKSNQIIIEGVTHILVDEPEDFDGCEACSLKEKCFDIQCDYTLCGYLMESKTYKHFEIEHEEY